jgi:hypothetical protein
MDLDLTIEKHMLLRLVLGLSTVMMFLFILRLEIFKRLVFSI